MSIRISFDSQLRYLPLMYFLPKEVIVKYPTLRGLPRKVREVMYSEPMMDIVNSESFLNDMMDAVSALAFPHFGFGGWKEHYSGDSPIWRLSYALPVWSKLLEKEMDWGLQALMNIHSSQTIPFFTNEYVKEAMERIVKRAIQEEGWQPVLDAVHEMPCDEDFEKWNTHVRIDFLRKWYHTRSKRVELVSLEAHKKSMNNAIYAIADNRADFEREVIAEDFYKRFKQQLSPQDMTILERRVEGATYEAIAKELGYKNHSGVLKRIRAIKNQFLRYEEESH